jgi:2-polyprenyl-6-methoxyphenol hydroxylase-like FAD-dependent oxidoreductase
MDQTLNTTCCIAGGGPAGIMLGYLLARAGIDVTVLEKHGDFFRDFRGDTIHPSTMELMHELGLLDEFLKVPHDEVTHLSAQIGSDRLTIADFTHMPTHSKFIALMPQWDFLDFIAKHGKTLPNFHLLMDTEATGLIEDGRRIAGVRIQDGGSIRAALTVAADGRHSILRGAAGLTVEDFAAPMDVLWFRISRSAGDSPETFGHVEAGHMMIMLNRQSYWQCAVIIRKGSAATLQQGPIEAFRQSVVGISPFLAYRIGEIRSWDDVKLLTVTIDRLTRWHRPGFLAIGDAAHAMSPIGGVGINLAIQDAVAAANALSGPLKRGPVDESVLAAIEQRRTFPTKVTQGIQIAIQKRLIDPVLSSTRPLRAPGILRFLAGIPALRFIPAYIVGVGVRPEHVRLQ